MSQQHMSEQVSVIVFLPATSAGVIASRLAEHGYSAIAVSSVADLRHALASDRYRIAVTTLAWIDTVRSIRAIMVVNMDIFFHPGDGGDVIASSRQFDGRAFLWRVKTLSELPPPRIAGVAGAIDSKGAARRKRHWWLSFGRLFRRGPGRDKTVTLIRIRSDPGPL